MWQCSNYNSNLEAVGHFSIAIFTNRIELYNNSHSRCYMVHSKVEKTFYLMYENSTLHFLKHKILETKIRPDLHEFSGTSLVYIPLLGISIRQDGCV